MPRKAKPPLLHRLAQASIRHHWSVLSAWALALVLIGIAAGVLGRSYSENFELPGAESQRAAQTLEKHFPQSSEQTAQIVLSGRGPLKRSATDAFLRQLEKKKAISKISSPFSPGGMLSEDGRVGVGTVYFLSQDRLPEREQVLDLIDWSKSATPRSLQVEWGGRVVTRAYSGPKVIGEILGLGAAMLILLVALRSVFLSLSPLFSTLISLGSVLILVAVSSNWVSIAEFAPQLAAMIGLGVGIDYGLFIVSRYRAEVERGEEINEAIAIAVSSAGRTVVFAGLTVVAALSGMCLLGISFLYGLALAMALAVTMTMLASLTALPALLHLLGRKAFIWKLPERKGQSRDIWRRWSLLVSRRPWPVALLTTGVLLLMALPALSMDLGAADAGNDPPGQTSRIAYDQIGKNFGPGSNGPLLLLGQGSPEEAQKVLGKETRLLSFSPPLVSRDGQWWQITALATSAPQDSSTEDLIGDLRLDLPAGVLLGGQTAASIDFESTIVSKLPLFFGVVIGIAILLLLIVFRSLLLALKAAILNLLSIAAALGATVALFQWGWFGDLLGIEPAPIEPFLPVMLFAIIFGLSMDYEVFLLSRIQEEWKSSGKARQAATRGLLATGRVITAAAAIMIVVFLSFVVSPERVVKEFGFALAIAVLIDAVFIRCGIVPALLQIMGRWAWWMPERLEKLLPRWKLEKPPGE